MSSFVAFMQSMTGRILRIVVGVALIAIGLLVVKDVWGIVLAVIGLVPLIAGLAGICWLPLSSDSRSKGSKSQPHRVVTSQTRTYEQW